MTLIMSLTCERLNYQIAESRPCREIKRGQQYQRSENLVDIVVHVDET